MAATVQAHTHHGAADDLGVNIAGATLRFKNADNDTQDGANQVARPGGAGFNYSYVKQLRLKSTVTPIAKLFNIKFWMSGPKPTGVDVFVKTSPAYINPVANASTALTGVTSGYSYTPSAPLSISGSQTNPSTGSFGDFLEAQMGAQVTAAAGVNALGPFIFRYDEQ